MEDMVLSESNVKTNIQLKGRDFKVLMDIGLAKGGDFWLNLKFVELDINSFNFLKEMQQLNSEIPIHSTYFTRESYPVKNIVIVKFNVDSNFNVEWECLSDEAVQLEL